MARWTLAFVAPLASSAGGQVRASSGDAVAKYSAIAGAVRDSLGGPIPRASLFVDGSPRTVVTDDSGHFVLRGLSPGKNGFTITKIGYSPVSFEATLLPDSMVVLAIRLHSVQLMDPVKVSAARVNEYLTRTGFVERKRAGLGTFLSPEKIDSVAPEMSQPSGLLRDVRGIDIRCPRVCAVHTHFPPDCLWLFVDGAPHGFVSQIDSVGVMPGIIAAIEVYERPSIVPAEFQGSMPMKNGGRMTTAAGCGAVAIWTKSRVP